jgi:acylaminoacyl-peptidase
MVLFSGFSMLHVNYRGSTGAGHASLSYLPGKAGDADVKDCVLATEEAIKRFPIDKERCLLFGWSHGGFLVTHLSGQYPDLYKAVVAGNPVTDIASMTNSSDIPDWSVASNQYLKRIFNFVCPSQVFR